MIPDRDSILAWLNENGKDTHWLAHQCGTNEPDIGEWINGTSEIPLFARLVMMIMMADSIHSPGSTRNSGVFSCSLPLTVKQVEILRESAAEKRMTLEDYIAQSSLVMSDRAINNDRRYHISTAPGIRLEPGYLTEFDCAFYQKQIDKVSAEKAVLEQFLEENGVKPDFDDLFRKYGPENIS